ncbi:cobalt transporter [Crocosphaera sp. UHCC 0190]|uniref:cobalt transporter n=1 Tax=Crocosphaera sp. UHCC 0190 TaxID=3110246 RepID=UPI002B219E50|nr:cobalt transporter [Crocosphaera sp. UHCC 0190]MEA5511384.1 cobalt transporter [Crocosphaera sp. UHCC 0190]
MKALSLVSLLSLSLTLGVPTVVLSHVGHGDEFQATGGIQKVQMNAETDQMLGIVVTPIEQTAADGVGVMIPFSALVDADGKQLVFVQYENYYEPVEVTTGATQGELIQVTKELSVGEKLVIQGSLSLYAESRKTKTAETEPTSEPITTSEPELNHAEADAQGIPHSHDNTGNMVKESSQGTEEKSDGFPIITMAAIGGGAVVLVGGALAIIGSGGKKKGSLSNRR